MLSKTFYSVEPDGYPNAKELSLTVEMMTDGTDLWTMASHNMIIALASNRHLVCPSKAYYAEVALGYVGRA